MNGKQVRIARLLNAKSGKSVIIPVDHGVILGSINGLTDPVTVLEKLIELKIDATLVGTGLGKVTEHLFERSGAPARVLTSDYPLLSTVPGGNEVGTEDALIGDVEFALRGGYDAVKVILMWGLEREKQLRNIKMVADLGHQCDRWGIPLMVEPMLWGDSIPAERKSDPELIEHAARIALEIGADILKIPYTGDKQGFAELVKRFRVPVMVLGGPKMHSHRDLLQVARDSMDAGAVSIVFGRNVWQDPAMEQIVKALQAIVHQGESVEKAASQFGLQ